MVKNIATSGGNVSQLVQRHNNLVDQVGDPALLETTDKTLVGAVNEISEVNNGGARITELDAKIDANKVISDNEDARLDTDLTALEQRFDTEQGDFANINSLLERSRNGFYDGGYSLKDNFTYPSVDALKDVYKVSGVDPVIGITGGFRYMQLHNSTSSRIHLPQTTNANKIRIRCIIDTATLGANIDINGSKLSVDDLGYRYSSRNDPNSHLATPFTTVNNTDIIFLEMEYSINSSSNAEVNIRTGKYTSITEAVLPNNSWNCLSIGHPNHLSGESEDGYDSTTGIWSFVNTDDQMSGITNIFIWQFRFYQLDVLVGDGANEITTTSASKTDEARFVGIDAEVLDLENRMDDAEEAIEAHDLRIEKNVARVSDVEEASGEGIDQTDIVHNEISGQDQIGSFNFTPTLSTVANGETVLMSGYFRFGVDREEGFDPNVSLRLYNTASNPRVLVKDFKQVEPSESFYWESDVVLGDSHTLEYESVEGGASVTYTPRVFALKYSFKGVYYDVIKNLISASTEERFNTNERVITNLRNDVADVKVANANQETEIDFNKQEIHTNATTLTALSEFVHTDAGNILLQGDVSGDSTVNTVATEANNNLNGGSPFVLRTSAGTNSAFRVVNVKDSTGAMSIGGHEIIRKNADNTVSGLIKRDGYQPADVTENVLLSNGTGTTTFEEPITGATAFGLDGSAVGTNNVIVNAHLVINGRDYDNVQLTVPGSNRSSRVSANLPAWAGATAEVTLTAFWVNNTLDFEITNNDTGNNAVSAGHVELTAHFVRTTTPAFVPEGVELVPLGQVHANMPFIVELRNGTIWIYTNSSRGEYDTRYSVASITHTSITGTRDVYYIASGATVTQDKYNTINSLADSPYLGMYRDVVSSENILTINSQFVSKSPTGANISMSDLLARIEALENA